MCPPRSFPHVEQGQEIADEFPGFPKSARLIVEGRVARYTELIPLEVRQHIEETLQNAGSIVSASNYFSPWDDILGPRLVAMVQGMPLRFPANGTSPRTLAGEREHRSN